MLVALPEVVLYIFFYSLYLFYSSFVFYVCLFFLCLSIHYANHIHIYVYLSIYLSKFKQVHTFIFIFLSSCLYIGIFLFRNTSLSSFLNSNILIVVSLLYIKICLISTSFNQSSLQFECNRLF